MCGYVEKVKQILKNFRENTGGIDATFLVDLKSARVQFRYPETANELDFIGSATARSIVQFHSQIKNMGETLAVKNMELEMSQDKMILCLRVSDDLILCVVCPIDGGAPSGIIRTQFERTVKNDILNAEKMTD
jgi:predicted regulator of Ras-like GTPase activity (Roadblock/LC7/MglB family)